MTAGKIFVSYRRDDTAGYAGRLAADLGRALGTERIFFDLHIGAGNDFIDELTQVIAECEVVLVLIGPRWVNAVDAEGRRRLDDAGDFVHQEVALSLKRGTRIIPLLFRGARVPAAGELPEPLRGLLRHQALEITDDRWDYDFARLVRALAPAGAPRRPRAYARRDVLLGAGAAGGGLLAVGGAALLGPRLGTKQPRSSGGEAAHSAGGRGSAGAIRGRVIDFFRRPVAGARVAVGDMSADTDAEGAFRLPAADATYSLRIDGPDTETWVYQGLSRRDPTVQIFRGTRRRAAAVSIRAIDIPRAIQAQDSVAVAVALTGRDVSWRRHEIPIPNAELDINWRGPAQITGTAHAFLWQRGADRYNPAAFLAHAEQPVTLGGAPAALRFDLAPGPPLPTRTLPCTVTGGPALIRWWLQLADGATVPFGMTLETEQASLLVPKLSGATILVSAHAGIHGGPNMTPFKLAHAETSATGGDAVALALPTAPRLDGPAAGATSVTGSTRLRWWSAAPNVSVLHLRPKDEGARLFVMTAATSLPLDAVGSMLTPGETYVWSVETHEPFASVDDLCRAPGGFLDRFSGDGDPNGPAGSGHSYARSEQRWFTWAADKLAGP